jgi:hypothetical protein
MIVWLWVNGLVLNIEKTNIAKFAMNMGSHSLERKCIASLRFVLIL